MVLVDASILAAISFYASMYNLPPKLITAVITVESSQNSSTIGPVGEVGLMQVRPEFHHNSRGLLFVPTYNIKEGTKRLAQAKKYCKHQDNYSWVVCYNRGIMGGARLLNPKTDTYYQKILKEMANENPTL